MKKTRAKVKKKKQHRRYFLLLEVMIAFALVVLCAIPLIYPHTYILRMQKEFIQEIELDHFVNQDFADLMVNLYKKQVSWNEISGQVSQSLNPPGIPVTGTRQFKEVKHKDKDSNTYVVYLFEVNYTFSNNLKYTYNVTLVRDLPTENHADNIDLEE